MKNLNWDVPSGFLAQSTVGLSRLSSQPTSSDVTSDSVADRFCFFLGGRRGSPLSASPAMARGRAKQSRACCDACMGRGCKKPCPPPPPPPVLPRSLACCRAQGPSTRGISCLWFWAFQVSAPSGAFLSPFSSCRTSRPSSEQEAPAHCMLQRGGPGQQDVLPQRPAPFPAFLLNFAQAFSQYLAVSRSLQATP